MSWEAALPDTALTSAGHVLILNRNARRSKGEGVAEGPLRAISVRRGMTCETLWGLGWLFGDCQFEAMQCWPICSDYEH